MFIVFAWITILYLSYGTGGAIEIAHAYFKLVYSAIHIVNTLQCVCMCHDDSHCCSCYTRMVRLHLIEQNLGGSMMWWLILKRLVSIHINNILCTWCVLLIAAHTLRYWFSDMYNYMYMCMYPLWLKALSHLILFECELNSLHTTKILKPNDNWIAVGVPHPKQPGQVTISTLVLSSQHSKYQNTH